MINLPRSKAAQSQQNVILTLNCHSCGRGRHETKERKFNIFTDEAGSFEHAHKHHK